MINGFINFYKPSGMTSAYALNKIKKVFKGEKLGHMGTLDPLAEGVLPVAFGKSTRLFDYLLDKTKVYLATFTFGYETDTLDSDGKVVNQGGYLPKKQDILSVLDKLVGEVDQIPPIYSAKCVAGKRSYELARSGVEINLPPKKVVINKIELTDKINENSFSFLIECKGGTYIRSICRDMANLLNTFATMTALKRLQSGVFKVENSLKIEDFEKEFDVNKHLIKPDSVINFESVFLTDSKYLDLINGRPCKIDLIDGFYKVYGNGEFIGVCESLKGNLKIKAYIKD